MTSTRDTQRQRVYLAEAQVRPYGLIFADMTQVLDYSSRVVNSEWWETHSNYRGLVTVVHRENRRGFATYKTGLIKLPRHAWHEVYVLHELAHLAHGVPHWHEAGHGPRYVETMHAMIIEFMGVNPAAVHRRACSAYGVLATLPGARLDLGHQAAANKWYEASYRRFREGQRSTPPVLRRGMTAAQGRAIRQRVDHEFDI